MKTEKQSRREFLKSGAIDITAEGPAKNAMAGEIASPESGAAWGESVINESSYSALATVNYLQRGLQT